METYPTQLERLGESELLIQWSDGQRRQYRLVDLRNACPCATCREKHKPAQEKAAEEKPAMLLPVLSAAEAQPLRLAGMRPVGNYAYSLAFSDGHDTGIYTFERLRELGREVAS